MPTNAPSAYEIHQAESRAQQHRSAETTNLVRRHRADVEEVIRTEGRMTLIEEKNSAYDADENFRERVAEDRSQWRCRGIFLAAVAVYTAGEFFASGDVADTLARQISPLFDLGAMSETPVWLRRLAGCGFVVIMLCATLFIKYAASFFCGKFEAAKARATIGEHSVFWVNTIGIWTTHLVKGAYFVTVAFLYLWLYGFAQDRAILTANDQKEEIPVAPLKFERGVVAAPEPSVISPDVSTSSTIGSRLGMAAGVLYICLWVLHGVVLVLPINGRELEFAHFKRGVNERRVHTMRENLGRVLRDLLERIHSVEGEPRELLIRETQPIVHLVNKAAGRDAMDTPPPPATEPSTASASPSSMHPSFTRTGVPAAQEPEDAFEAIFGKQSA